MKIQFLGDLSLDGIYCDPQQHELLSQNMEWLSNQLGKCDLRIINWESPLWGNGEVNTLKNPRLCTTKEAATSILSLNLNVALLANNHIYDNGYSGFKNTTSFFAAHSIYYVGACKKEEDIKVFLYEKDDVSIALLNFVGGETNPNLPNDCNINLNILDEKNILKQIKELRKSVHHIIVCLHWGKEELVRIPTVKQRKLARNFIESGASLVIGSHVHCLQGLEKWGNGYICYSIGNFLFSPHLVVPGRIDSFRTKDSRLIAIPEFDLSCDKIKLKWNYFHRNKMELLIKADENNTIRRYHNSLCKALKRSDKCLSFLYKKDKFIMPFRSFIDKNGGFLKALLSVRIKQIQLLKKL